MKDHWEQECVDLRGEMETLQQQMRALAAQQASARTLVRWGVSQSLKLFLPVCILLTAGGVLYGQGAMDALFIDQNGKVGIGTTTPEQILDIRSNGKKNPFAIDNALFLGGLDGTVRVTNNAYLNESGNWQIKNPQKKAFTLEIRDSGMLELYGTVTNGQADWRKLATFDAANNAIKFEAPVSMNSSVNGVSFQNALVPAGTIMAYGGDTANADIVKQLGTQGWLPCNGAAVSRTDYADLFKAIGTAFGIGDSRTTFQVPDLRGRFPRGTNQGAGRDPDAANRRAEPAGGNSGDRIGSVQDDDFRSHTHGYNQFPGNRGGIASGSYWEAAGAQTAPAGGNETRPKNIYVNWIIKAKNT